NTGTDTAPATPVNQFKPDGVFYNFRMTTSGSGANSVMSLQCQVSADGSSAWSAWKTLKKPDGTDATYGTWIDPDTGLPAQSAGVDLTGVKLESPASQWVGNKWVYAAHREEAGTTYNLAHLLLASCYPGDAWAAYNGNDTFKISDAPEAYASGEVTFDNRPMGLESRDMSIYVDDADGYAYALCSGISDLTVHLLKSDWSAPSGIYQTMLAGQNRETPDFIKTNGYYYLFSSKQNGWYPTQTRYVWIPDSLKNKASTLIAVGNQGSFGSQFNHNERFRGALRDSYGMWGYRWAANWDGNAKETSPNNPPRLVPLVFNKDFAAAAYFRKVSCFADYGLVGIQSGQWVSLGKSVTQDPAYSDNPGLQYNDPSVITDGCDNADVTFFRGITIPYSLIINLETPAVIKEVAMTVYLMYGSDTAARYQYYGSNDNETWTMLYDGSNNYRPGFVVDDVTDTTAYQYFKVTITAAPRDARHTMNAAGWADGIVEVAVYGTPVSNP
ncbi:MAG: hypothetical protein FWF29_02095, partial [Treponema sp.]|nr:hypothetical protein [Treponema sp.]